VTIRLRERGVQALVLDIEGTTTPIAFVYDVLFPFARANLHEYLRDHLHTDEVHAATGRLRAEWAKEREDQPPDWPDPEPERSVESIVTYVGWLMDRDRKSPALKWLQGAIWDEGYHTGVLKGEVFDDVPPAFERWSEGGIEMGIYSSGSELAQRRLFETTPYGDLTRFIKRFFDTAIGPKASADSYRRIAVSMPFPIERMLFVSDVVQELDAARSSGCQVALCVRPRTLETPRIVGTSTTPRLVGTAQTLRTLGTPHTPSTLIAGEDTPVIHGFDEILV